MFNTRRIQSEGEDMRVGKNKSTQLLKQISTQLEANGLAYMKREM